MKREKWEMTYNQYCEDYLNNCKYAKSYKNDVAKWENKKHDLLNEWYQILQDRAEVGEIPEIVIRSLINEIGEPTVKRIFRGTKAKGLYNWEQTQIKKVYREPIKENYHICNIK